MHIFRLVSLPLVSFHANRTSHFIIEIPFGLFTCKQNCLRLLQLVWPSLVSQHSLHMCILHSPSSRSLPSMPHVLAIEWRASRASKFTWQEVSFIPRRSSLRASCWVDSALMMMIKWENRSISPFSIALSWADHFWLRKNRHFQRTTSTVKKCPSALRLSLCQLKQRLLTLSSWRYLSINLPFSLSTYDETIIFTSHHCTYDATENLTIFYWYQICQVYMYEVSSWMEIKYSSSSHHFCHFKYIIWFHTSHTFDTDKRVHF